MSFIIYVYLMSFKKVLYSVVLGAGLILGTSSMALAQGAAGTTSDGFGVNAGNTADVMGVAGTGTDTGDGIINVIRTFLNWVLGLLSFIAFAFLLYGGFQMVTAGGDSEWYKKGFTILKNAAIGLAFIALSWLIVTLIFYVLNLISGAG